jgi:hypothetical protein
MTHDEIKGEIVAGNIAALTLDTSVFGSPDETSLETTQLASLAQFKDSTIKFILSDIVVLEVSSHLIKQAKEAQTKLNRAVRLVERSWKGSQVAIEESINSVLATLPPEILTKQRFDAFIEMTGGVIVEAKLHAKIDELVNRYFQSLPPFAINEAKKYEFPDAIALLTLESWAEKAGKKVLVVSKDGDWVNYCKTSDRLIVVQQLSVALSLFHSDANFVCKMLYQRLNSNDYPDLLNAIVRAIDSHVENMNFDAEASSAYYFDNEIYDTTIVNYSIMNNSESLVPLDFSDDYLVAELSVSIDITVCCDFQFSTKDWVDKDYVLIGSSTKKITKSIDLTAVISFARSNPNKFEIDEVEITSNLNMTIDFGEIEPEWRDYED